MSIRLSGLKRPLALLLAICLTLSLVVTGFSVPVSAADDIEGDETANYLKVPISSAEQLKDAMAGSSYDGKDYSDYDGVELDLQDNITMSSATAVTTWSYNFVIDGDKGTKDAEGNMERYTLTADASSDFNFKMFTPGSTSGNTTLTFINMEVDVNGQYFFFLNGTSLAGSTVNLTNVKLKNMRSTGNTTSNAAICIAASNANSAVQAVNFTKVTTEDCTGQILNYKNVKNVTITDSKLHSGVPADGIAHNDVIYPTTAANASVGQTLTIDNSTISWDEGAVEDGIYMGNYNTLKLTGGTTLVEITDEEMDTGEIPAVYLGQYSTLILDDCSIQKDDGSSALVQVNNSNDSLQISGKVQGEPVLRMANNLYIQLAEGWQGPVKFEFSASIANKDPKVAEGMDGYTLTDADLAQLIYNDENAARVLGINEEDGCAYLYRANTEDCNFVLDTSGALDPDDLDPDVDYDGPVFSRNENDGALEPDVAMSMGDKEYPADGNYTVEYSGNTKVPEGSEAGTLLKAQATVKPGGNLVGDDVPLSYYILVNTTFELTPDNTTTVLTYENGTYNIAVTYYGQDDTTGTLLKEGENYMVVYRIDGDSYTITATISGAGDYIGSYEVTFDLPGKRTVTNETELNQALEQRVAYIEFGNDIDDLTGPVEVDYDVVIDGAGYTLSPDQMANDLESDLNYAILSVSSGQVVLTDLTVDGNDQARLLYVGSEADVVINGSTLQHGGLGVWHDNYVLPRRGMTAYIEEGGTLTLDDCIVRDGGESVPAIYNLGELNIQNDTYLTNLPGAHMCAIQNGGTLNWTSGTFDVNLADGYTNGTMSTSTGSGTVIENRGIFNMGGTAELNGYLLDENEQHTDEQTQVVTGAVHVTNTGEFNLSGDAVITGFQSIGFESGFVTNYACGGGGVYNNGIFNMSGGKITGNSAESAGGGVFNAGIFNMTGGEITDNTAAIGGGIYNDFARDYTHEKSSYVSGAYDAGEFYMSDGIVSYNHLTSDTIEITGRNLGMGMMGGNNGSIDAVGSELYVSGGCTVEISGGTIVGNTENKVASDGDEDNAEDVVKVPVGIAVVPAQDQQVMQSPDGHVVVADNASMTVTGNADIDINTGVVLISENNYSGTGHLENLEEVKNDPDAEYKVEVDTEPVLTTDQTAWLDLNGTLATPLKINTIDVENVTIRITDATGSNAGTNIPESVDGGSDIYVNSDGDLVAVYKDRVTPDESDAQWLQVDGSSIFMKYDTRTYESEVTVYDGDDDDEGHTEMVETTVDAYMWEICNHTEGLEYAPAEEATCTESGNNACWYCPVCLKLFEDEAGTKELSTDDVYIPALGHEIQNVDQLDATCTKDGYTAGAMCVRCGMFFDDDSHEQPASERVIEALGHNYVIMPAVPATATTDGWSEYVWCDRCKTNLTEPELIPAGSQEEPDTSALEALVDATEAMTDKMNSSDYTEDSWEALQVALTNAKNVADNPDSTEDDIAAAMEDLTAAINGLESSGSEEDKIGFVQEGDEWHYYNSDGTRFTGTDIKEDTKKVVDGTDGWFYIENGKINFSCNSVEQNAYGWWYVLNGKVDFSYTGVANYSNAYGWWYISGGKVDFSKTGIEQNNYGWWRVVNGQVDFSCNSVEQNDYGWWYLVGGKVQFDYTGVANYANAYGWWYVSGGKVDFSKTSIEQNNYGWWRVVNGKVDFSCNSVEQNDYGWWYVVGGKVQFSYTGVVNYTNAYGWWYVKGGKVDFSYTGRASNNYGTWNVVNGKVVF